MRFNETVRLELQLQREGDIYHVPTTYPTQSEKDTDNVYKGGGDILHHPTGKRIDF